ncbi:MAG: hypothetical protein MI867_27300, partial [Pseudomonadales bacterium]|nr:hypothetical protein [Pseudomonadales bacterium]
PADDIRLGLQIFARDLGNLGNLDPQIDWGFGEYRKWDYLGFRAGLIKMPLGMYNRERDADFLRPSIFQPQSVYDEEFRDLTLAYQGFAVFGNLAGHLDYELFVGTVDLDENLPILQTFLSELGPFPNSPDAAFEIDLHHINGGSLVWETPLTGVRLGVSAVVGDATVLVPELNDMVFAELDRIALSTLSLEYVYEDFTVQAEWKDIDLTARGELLPHDLRFNPVGWYILTAYHLLERIELSYNYDVSYTDAEDKDGTGFESRGLPAHLAWTKDHTLSIRYDLSNQLTLKAEGHWIDGTSRIADPPVPVMARDWFLFAAKASYNF